ncbi:hypothetical protein RRF57_006097 [Xylaria bambusicola]|uniref:Uncharacterized protein n=1 Tax=Xylaria bambusicola TaxID=326684 RepID=A0AAN7Z6J7_9PEZI
MRTYRHFVLEDVFGGRAEGPVDIDSRQHTAERGVYVAALLIHAYNFRGVFRAVLLAELASQRCRELSRKVAHDTYRDLGTAEEDVLPGARLRVLLLDLDLADVAGVLDDLGDVRLMAAAHLSRDALCEVDEATVHPILPENADGRRADRDTERRRVWLDHAEGAMDRPEQEEDDEHVVRVPETLVVSPTGLLDRCEHHAHEGY